MHHSVPGTRMGHLPSMSPFCTPPSPLEFDLESQLTPLPSHKGDFSTSWELRCLRKHRRRDDGVCSVKRRRFHSSVDALSADSCSATPLPEPSISLSRPCPVLAPPHTHTDHSWSMEVDAAQRKLREIESRITLEDDSDSDLDLELDVCPRRPVLVLSDSLKEGLQRGLSDILPHTVAQSVSHSCMELVLWRPPDDPFSHCLKDSVPKSSTQQRGSQQNLTSCPSPTPHTDSHSPLYMVLSSGDEEDMEM